MALIFVFEELYSCEHMETSMNTRFNWLRRCWRRNVLVTVMATLVTNIQFDITSGINIQKMSPTLSHQHHHVINNTAAIQFQVGISNMEQ